MARYGIYNHATNTLWPEVFDMLGEAKEKLGGVAPGGPLRVVVIAENAMQPTEVATCNCYRDTRAAYRAGWKEAWMAATECAASAGKNNP